ncbi:SCP2 sterol-binding domain-containing protein [Otariodibacter sp.]|uniref:ubiquinone biosynthesis accessory factor UbiJ n=1 Tax=Otariodibacter sp. TaxID=3030919 RepID=UPI00261F25DA|nr:SCP2 sterol-binding domain-containing protein [Otariodibacter sp.]
MNKVSGLFAQLMLPQIAMGGLETTFNALIARSPHTISILRKLVGKNLHIHLNHPTIQFVMIFSEKRVDFLSNYEGENDCTVTLEATALPKLADKAQLTNLLNNKSLVLEGDIQVLQHFSSLLDELEKDPAELLSPFVGDVVAQASTDFVKQIISKVNKQFTTLNQDIVDNLMVERPVLVHRLQAVYFYDQVEELEKQAVSLEQKFAKLGI